MNAFEFNRLIAGEIFFYIAMVSLLISLWYDYRMARHTRGNIPIHRLGLFLSKRHIKETGWPLLRKSRKLTGIAIFCLIMRALVYPFSNDPIDLELSQEMIETLKLMIIFSFCAMTISTGMAALYLIQVLKNIREDISSITYIRGPFLLSRRYVKEAGWLSLQKFWKWFRFLVFCLFVQVFLYFHTGSV